MWRVYYDDGRTWDSTQPRGEMPSYGVLVILQQRSSDGRWYLSSNAPYYILCTEDEWLHAYNNDLVDYLVHKPGHIKKLIVGRMVSKAEFVAVYEQAKKDREAMD